MKNLTTIIFLFILSSCKVTSGKKAASQLFSTSYNELKIDSELCNVVYNKGYFFISQENEQVAVLDTFFQRQQQIEDSINKFPIRTIYQTNDSIIFYKYNDKSTAAPEAYYLTNDFKLKTFKEKMKYSQLPGEELLEDSLYIILANRKGEYGFFTYFLEKSTKKIFAIESYKPRQAIKFRQEYYIVCDGNNYDSTNTGIIKIEDPKKLFEITIRQAEKLNILYTHLAPSPGEEYRALADTIKKRSFNSYGYLDSYSVPIYTFQKGNELFTIINNGTSIYLGKHNGNNFQKVQQLFDTAFDISDIYPMHYKNNTLIIFDRSGGKMSNGQMVDYFDCGFFNLQTDKIDLYRLYRERRSKWQ